MVKTFKTLLLIAVFGLASNLANAATLKSGSCRGVSTPNGFKYVGTYCEDYACSVISTYMFDSWCPYSV
jgi:Co/Zn/Cd efflux system component